MISFSSEAICIDYNDLNIDAINRAFAVIENTALSSNPSNSNDIHDVHDINTFVNQISTWNRAFIDAPGESNNLNIDAINNAFTVIENQDRLVAGMIINQDSYAKLRLMRNFFDVETHRQLLSRGLLGYLFGSCVYVRRIVPQGHFFLFSDSPDNLIEGFRFVERQKTEEDIRKEETIAIIQGLIDNMVEKRIIKKRVVING